MAAVEGETSFELKTVPYDTRFPNQNQSKNCWQNYVDYFRCVRIKTEKDQDPTPCEYFKDAYTALCPIDWVSRWDSQRERGAFAGNL